MKNILLICFKEFKGYFVSPIGYAVMALFALIFGAACFFLQLEELIENLAFGGIESAAQRAVEAGERGAVFVEQATQRFFVRIEATGQRAGQKFAFHLFAEELGAAENVADFEIEFREHSRDQRIDQGESGARNDGGHAAEQRLVNNLVLRHVGNFGRASNVGRGRKKSVLDDGPKQDVG